MAKRRGPVDKVRASRDGHEYHEAWTARKAMQLLWPDSKLAAIAVEGLSPADQKRALSETVDIADITLYYGQRPTFEHASHTTIVQFKYSVSDKSTDFRASHAKKTLTKFAKTYRDYREKYGAEAVQDRLDFELATNRSIYKPLHQAMEALAKGLPRTGEIQKQANQFQSATGLDGKPLAMFAAKCKIVSLSGNLPTTKGEIAGLIVDWSATNDPIAAARLGHLRQMVRDKAGYAGTNRNLITRTDILAALAVGDPEDLLPCQPALPDVGKVVEREQLADAIAILPGLSAPLLIHAAGGVGKTVFMDSIADAVREHSEVVFFDCFGGGAYRSPEDARHLPKKGLIHIANTLAFRGLCDPILPDSTDIQSLLRTFRRRLEQCVSTLKRLSPGKDLTLFIDAIDNAELFARERSEESFPVLVLESLHHEPVSGVRLIVSSRTERKPSTHARYREFELRPFSINETADYLRPRLRNVSPAEINVAQARSGGNPRVLEYLVKSGRGLLDESEIDKEVELDDLIQQRITGALAVALERGYEREDINAFLAGLAVLPPPVPLDEYAGAHGMEQSAIESFAADLRPLLERTNQGLMFRDEPTETLVRNRYASSEGALRRVAANLLARQNDSVYAARALPGLLHSLDDGGQLFQLAFDDRIPAQITSTVGKRNIRYARIKAAVLHAAIKRDQNRLVRLLLELSTIAAVDQRGADYLLDCPDLVVAAQDVDATRRHFETRTGWPGTRHARLAIANSLAGDSEEAYRHAIATSEWVHHHRRTDREDRMNRANPERPDIAAMPFFLICQGRPDEAIMFLQGWRNWYAYEVCEYVFNYYQLAASIQPLSPRKLAKFVNALTDIGPLAAALSFHDSSKPTRKDLVVRLSRACKKSTKLNLTETYQRERPYQLQDGLRKASALALSMGMVDEALTISLRAPHKRPGIWSLSDNLHYSKDVFPFLFRIALVAAAKNRILHEKDVIPRELVPVCVRIKKDITGNAFRTRVKERLTNYLRRERDEDATRDNKRTLSYEQKQEAERFIDLRLEPLLALTKALADLLAASPRRVDNAFIELLKVWEGTRKSRDPYQTQRFDNLFRVLGLETSIFALWARNELKPSSIKRFLKAMHGQDIGAHTLVQVVSILAQRGSLQVLAGEQALQARSLIESEDEVTRRASHFADLGRAMLPASIDDASAYFRDGLEQMDAIGSGDYTFTNELLLFASTLRGDELDERDFHTLTNVCELNMGEEPEKFFWSAFAKGMSRAAGPRGLAKLSRWDDRSKVRLENTLLPYLTALVDDGKIEPEIALALNRLANPVEYYTCGTTEFAQAIKRKVGTTRPNVVSELIRQFEDDNPGLPMASTVKVLASLAEETFGRSSETTTYLSAAHKRFAKVRETTNDHMNYRGEPDTRMRKRAADQALSDSAALKVIAAATDPTDQGSLGKAIEAANDIRNIGDVKGGVFASLRHKVSFNARAQYVRNIYALENLGFFQKLTELKACKEIWGKSSAALSQVYENGATPLVRLHADDLISHGSLSGYALKEISDLTSVAIAELVLELIKVFALPDSSVPGAVWLAFASFICPEADVGQGQLALKRLLRSDAAKLADNVIDGAWVDGLYPEDDMRAVAAGLVWRMLGSPSAEDRWRAAHSIRCFARFGRWDVVDALVDKLGNEVAGPFQAGELKFYHLHARLWLLIALARMAIDHPKEIGRYSNELLSIATDADPHVLMRHFAARTLLICINSGSLGKRANIVEQLRMVDLSPHPRLNSKNRERGGFYHGRSDSAAEPQFEFHLDYDFHKHDVDSLSEVFGKPCWEVADMISETVHRFDSNASSMNEPDGRQEPYRRISLGIDKRYHTYGQQLGWHALFMVAGKLLQNYPVTNDLYYCDDPWGEWLGRYTLTRNDGFWLSDGTDRTPLDAAQILLEKAKSGIALTGDRHKLLQLAGINSRIDKEIVVNGTWQSSDHVRVHISSALVPPGKAQRLARKLTREEPMIVWVPTYDENEDDREYLRGEKKEYTPWIVCPSGEGQLDESDPYGASGANLRPRLSCDCASALWLSTGEPFGRYWRNRRGTVVVRAQAWGREDKYSEEGPHSGLRLYCSAPALKRILKKYDKDLLLLISLKRYEKEGYRGSGKFTHTVAVLRVSGTLDLEYFKGRVNHLHKSRY